MTASPTLCAFPITPISPEGRVNTQALGRLVGRLVEAGVDSIGLLGSTGTYAYLSRSERRRALAAALAVTAGRVPVLVGVGALRTDEAVALAQDARALGAAGGLLAPVSYTPLNDDEVLAHFEAVAGQSGLPLCIYDNPATTRFTFSPALVGRLAGLPGVVALKGPAPEATALPANLAALRAVVPPGFSLGYSVDWHAAAALLAGGQVWYSVAAGLFPAPCRAVVGAIREGEADRARALNAGLAPLWALFRRYSSLRVSFAAARLLGLCDEAPPRPILPLPEAAQREVAAVLESMAMSG